MAVIPPVVVYGVIVAPLILVNVMLSGEDCHCIVPVEPVSVNVVFEPEQTGLGDADAVPATTLDDTVTVTVFDVLLPQFPFVTIAL